MMPERPPKCWQNELAWCFTVVGLVLLLSTIMAISEGVRTGVITNDFSVYYLGMLVLKINPADLYINEAYPRYFQLLLEHGAHLPKYWGFLYPPFAALLFAPLAYVSFMQAYWTTTALNLALLLWCFVSIRQFAASMGLKREKNLLASLLVFNPVVYVCINNLQLGILFAALLLQILRDLRAGRYVLAACILALLAHIKPQHFIPLSVFLFVALPWRFRIALGASHLLLFSITFAYFGVGIWADYVQLITSIKPDSLQNSTGIKDMPTLYGMLSGYIGQITPATSPLPTLLYGGWVLISSALGYACLRGHAQPLTVLPCVALMGWFLSPWFHMNDAVMWVPVATLLLGVGLQGKTKLMIPAFLFLIFAALSFIIFMIAPKAMLLLYLPQWGMRLVLFSLIAASAAVLIRNLRRPISKSIFTNN